MMKYNRLFTFVVLFLPAVLCFIGCGKEPAKRSYAGLPLTLTSRESDGKTVGLCYFFGRNDDPGIAIITAGDSMSNRVVVSVVSGMGDSGSVMIGGREIRPSAGNLVFVQHSGGNDMFVCDNVSDEDFAIAVGSIDAWWNYYFDGGEKVVDFERKYTNKKMHEYLK